MHRRLLVPIAVAAALLAAGCGSKSEEPEVAFTIVGTAPETAPTSSTPVNLVCDPEIVTPPDVADKPVAEVPEGEAPPELVSTDLVEGTGAEAQPGDTVQVEYVGVLYDGGTQFDASWDRGAEPFEFQLGAGMVIPGWDQGVAGMKVGGRQLVIPSDPAYGDAGAGGDILPGATLVFVVDLLQVCTPDTSATTGATTEAGVEALGTTEAAAG